MPKCIAALFGYAQTLVTGLFRAPRGRHSTRHNAPSTRAQGNPRILRILLILSVLPVLRILPARRTPSPSNDLPGPRSLRPSSSRPRSPRPRLPLPGLRLPGLQWLRPRWLCRRWLCRGPWPAKRQRSRRVRPFAPEQPPAPLSVPAQPAVSAPSDRPGHSNIPSLPGLPGPSHRPSPSALPDPWALTAPSPATASGRTQLAPPAEHVPADEVALVRPYFRAHERSRQADVDDLRQRTAADRLTAWGADLGALVAPLPSSPHRPHLHLRGQQQQTQMQTQLPQRQQQRRTHAQEVAV